MAYPLTAANAAECEAFAWGTIARDANRDAIMRVSSGRWWMAGVEGSFASDDLAFPLEILAVGRGDCHDE